MVKMSWYPASCRERLLQRVPIGSTFIVLVLSLWGPMVVPVVFAAFNMAVHAMVLYANLRTIYGTLRAWRGVRVHAGTDWQEEYGNARIALGPRADFLEFEDVEHLIVIPNYNEDITVLRETLYLLSTHHLAKSYRPVLAMEARERGASTKAEILCAEYHNAFARGGVAYTLHRGGIQGEAAGKSSNLAWATRQAWTSVCTEDSGAEARVVITVIDSDTALAGDYFAAVSCKFALRPADERARMSFVPPIVFDRNAHEVPVTVRLVDMLWAMAGLSAIYPSSRAKIPTSAYSMSLALAAKVGFWDAGPGAIGEDLHMYIKTLFCTGGNLISETIYSPASQLDVVAENRQGIRGWCNDHRARYTQAVRHLWGSLDTGYALDRVWRGSFSPCVADFLSARRQGVPVGVLGWDKGASVPRSESFYTSGSELSDLSFLEPVLEETTLCSSMELDEKLSLSNEMVTSHPEELNISVTPFVTLFMRLYEAHLLIGHMTVLTVVRVLSTSWARLRPPTAPDELVTSTFTSLFLDWSRDLSAAMRPLFVVLTVCMVLAYDRYHQQAARHRWVGNGDRLGAQPSARSYRSFPMSTLDVLALPGGFLIGVLPAFHAQVMHIFTDRLQYTVSFKPAARPIPARDVEKGLVA